MSRIKILSEYVASQIAAGEVVQRPVSVVKELVENSIDAGASRIKVEIEGGGIDLIRVSDDGCGMSAEDLSLSIRRHATSKIELESDLLSIQTFGFRGEALAAISSVARVEIISRTPNERHANRLLVEGENAVRMEQAGSPPGTVIQVKDLFYNIPARRKFLKSPVTEMERISESILRFALTFPEIHFDLEHNSRKVRSMPPVPSIFDRLIQVWGAEFVKEMVPFDHADDRIHIHGFTSKPIFHKKTAEDIRFFVNNRSIKDRLLLRAVTEAYRASLPQRRYPIVFMYLDLLAQYVDVNVHPAKEEIRFQDEKLIWSVVYHAIRKGLSGESGESPLPIVQPQEDTCPTGDDGLDANAGDLTDPVKSTPFNVPTNIVTDITPIATVSCETDSRSNIESIRKELVEIPIDLSTIDNTLEKLNRSPLLTRESELPKPGRFPWKAIAQVFNSYILCESMDEMAIFDQHALHERIMFEKYRQQKEQGTILHQQLLFPVTYEAPPHWVDMVNSILEVLNQSGFEMEHFGGQTFLIHAIPADLKIQEIEGTLTDILQDMNEVGLPSPLSDRMERILARMACRSAVKAGDILTLEEMQALIDEYVDFPRLMTCPHGRPPIWKIGRKELDRLFDRP